jgi:UPF0755 protein
MTKRKHRNISIFTGGLILVALVYIFTGQATPQSEQKIVFVEKNADSQTILEKLKEQGLIKNKITYYVVKALSDFVEEIEPGGYVLPRNLNALALHSVLTEPEYKYVAVIEGMRKEEIGERFGETLGWSEEKIDSFKTKYPACPYVGREGYLAPGDYLVKSDATIQSIKNELEDRFNEKISNLTEKEKEKIFNLDQVVTIASLIQREAGGKNDMRLISGVIWNRLFEGMPLQIDATLQYVKGEDGLWWPRVKSEDKFIDSPYNTYQQSGLPPAPISNPGKAALEAAMDPAKTDCLFYLHDEWGRIHCSTDYDGHLDNIKRYLK